MEEAKHFFGRCTKCGHICTAISSDLPVTEIARLVHDLILDGQELVLMTASEFRDDPTISFGCTCDDETETEEK